MIKKNTLKQLIITIVITVLFVFNSGIAQTNNRELCSSVYDEVVDMVVRAFNDSSIKIAICKNAGKYAFSTTEDGVALDLLPPSNLFQILLNLGVLRISAIDELRGDIDSLIFVRTTLAVFEGSNLPSVGLVPGSEWILFLESPFDHNREDNDGMLEKFKQLNAKAYLNSKNFFNLYEYCYGGVCIDWPKGRDFSPKFIYSKGLVDDFRTIIKLKKDPSLLSASANSYDTYYDSLKDDLGKQVFSRLFAKPEKK